MNNHLLSRLGLVRLYWTVIIYSWIRVYDIHSYPKLPKLPWNDVVLSQLADCCCPRDTLVDSSCDGRYLLHGRDLRHRALYKPGANHESDRGLTLGLHPYPVYVLILCRATWLLPTKEASASDCNSDFSVSV